VQRFPFTETVSPRAASRAQIWSSEVLEDVVDDVFCFCLVSKVVLMARSYIRTWLDDVSVVVSTICYGAFFGGVGRYPIFVPVRLVERFLIILCATYLTRTKL
jgi:hypothetical protein